MTHLDRYRGRPEIASVVAGADRHIPRTNAETFRDALAKRLPHRAVELSVS